MTALEIQAQQLQTILNKRANDTRAAMLASDDVMAQVSQQLSGSVYWLQCLQAASLGASDWVFKAAKALARLFLCCADALGKHSHVCRSLQALQAMVSVVMVRMLLVSSVDFWQF